ncbi:type I secretion system permease/ATPase [Mesorhizobium sp. GR13]|uniref:type I secretion system permease/ATPase n=1 Tax=Mesorhizobium sp. GR13 TaxID=2562308 RepID=UPI001485470F|nr:type I secretion system permease/ATPase [Mesorhizobium sp. GR13]
MIELLIFSTMINVLLLVSPLYLLQIYDRVLPASNLHTLVYLTILAVGALVFLGLFEIVRSTYSQRIAASIDRAAASKTFLSLLSDDRYAKADLQPLRDLSTLRSFVGSRGLATLFDLPFVPFFIALLALVHPALAIVTTGGAAIMFGLVVLSNALTKRAVFASGEETAAANLKAQAFVRSSETIRAMGMERNVLVNWGKVFAKSLASQDAASSKGAIFASVSRAFRMLLQIVILGVGAWLVLDGNMTAGMIFAASILSGRALQPIDQLIAGWRQMIEARKAWERIHALLIKTDAQELDGIQLPVPQGKIKVQDLIYRAVPDPQIEPILKRVSFDINAGETIAIVGPSRAGKTTLARLLVGALQPTAGSVSIDGANLATNDGRKLCRYVGYLAQDVQLLPGTVAENISRFDIAGTDDEVLAAAKKAHAHELILALSDGYQTKIGIGSVLSGGERQRIGLARAFYGATRVLVLDEPNANLDEEGDQALMRALNEARDAGTTAVVITHRLSLAARCDRILVLRNGVVDIFGPAKDVFERLRSRMGATPPGGQGQNIQPMPVSRRNDPDPSSEAVRGVAGK